MNRLRLEASSLLRSCLFLLSLRGSNGPQAILAFPQLAKYDKQWPAIDLVRQYLENSASYRTKKVIHSNTAATQPLTLKILPTLQATVTLKKRLAATDGTVSRGRKIGKRGEGYTVIRPIPIVNLPALIACLERPRCDPSSPVCWKEGWEHQSSGAQTAFDSCGLC